MSECDLWPAKGSGVISVLLDERSTDMPSTNFISTFCAQFKLFSLNLDLHRCSESIGVFSVNTLVEFFAYYLCNFLHVYFRVLPSGKW